MAGAWAVGLVQCCLLGFCLHRVLARDVPAKCGPCFAGVLGGGPGVLHHRVWPPELGMGLGLRRGRGRAAAGRGSGHFRGPRMAAQGAAGPSVSDLASGGAGLLLRRSGCHGGCGRRLGKLPARRRTGGSHNRPRCGVLFRNAALPTLTASAGRGGGGTDAGRAGAGGSAAARPAAGRRRGEAPRGRPSFEPQRGVTAGGAAGLSGPQAAVLRRCGGYLVARGVIARP